MRGLTDEEAFELAWVANTVGDDDFIDVERDARRFEVHNVLERRGLISGGQPYWKDGERWRDMAATPLGKIALACHAAMKAQGIGSPNALR